MKREQDKTKEQPLNELAELRRRIASLEALGDEHKRTEEEITRFKTIADTAPYGVAISSIKGDFIYVNNSFSRMHGYTKNELTGRNFSILYPDEELETMRTLRNTLIEDGTHYMKEWWRKRKDGTSFPSFTYGHVLKDEDGNPLYVIGSVIDITERKKAEEEYEKIFNLSPDMVGIFTTEGELVKVNHSWETILGYKTEELLKMGWANLVHPDDVERTNKEVEEQLKGSPVVNFINRYKCKDGSYKTLEWQATFAKGGIVYATARDITERKRAEERLQQSEENLRAYLESAPDGIYINDLKGTFLYGNKKAEEIMGYKREELIGKSFLKLKILSARDLAKAGSLLALNIMGKSTGPDEFELVRKDGSPISVEINTTPIKQGGKIVVIGLVRYITERKRAEEEIGKFKAISDSAGYGAAIASIEGEFLYLNEAYARMHGYTIDELIGKHYSILYTEESLQDLERFKQKLLQKGTFFAEELWRRRKDNTIFPSLTTAGVVKDDQGNPLYIAATVSDITERKKTEEALRESEERYRALVDLGADFGQAVVLQQDNEKGIAIQIFINDEWSRITGYSKDELIGMAFTNLIHPKYRKATIDRYKKRLKSELVSSMFEISIIRKDGSEVPIEGTASGTMYKGKPAVVGYFRDITERKQAEERESQLQEELTMTSRLASVGEMAAGIAHEINNPLTGVVGFSDLLLQKDLPEEVRKDVTIIYEGAQRVASITRRMLTFARQQKQEKTSVDINDIIETTLEMRTYALGSSNIKLVKQLEGDLPKITADAGQLQQVFLNIILNAETEMVKAHKGGNLLVKTEKVDNTIRISFKDDGPGILKKNLDKVFDPFFTTREVGQGAGLGLSVSHGIVSQHSGRIYVKSQPGKGATFVVELPIVIKDEQLEMEVPTTEVPKAASKTRVLVIDDEPMVQQYLNDMLTGEGYEVQVTDNASAALINVRNHQYDVILLDIKMPGTDGIDLYKHLQKTDKSVARKVIFITGDVMARNTMAFLSRTKAPYIAKPFDAEQLRKEMARITSP